VSTEEQSYRDPPDQSVDWRFLLPFSKSGKSLFIGERSDYLKIFFEDIGFPSIAWPSTISLSEASLLNPHKSTFNIIAFPFGIRSNIHISQANKVEFFTAIRRLLEPGGVLFFGFNNIWRRNVSETITSTPHQMRIVLRKAGYPAPDYYAAYSNLMLPEYIFPLKSAPYRFALKFHLRNRIPHPLLWFLSNKIMLSGVSNFLPSYFAVVRV
jgi:hypothetical protein